MSSYDYIFFILFELAVLTCQWHFNGHLSGELEIASPLGSDYSELVALFVTLP